MDFDGSRIGYFTIDMLMVNTHPALVIAALSKLRFLPFRVEKVMVEDGSVSMMYLGVSQYFSPLARSEVESEEFDVPHYVVDISQEEDGVEKVVATETSQEGISYGSEVH